MALTGGRSIKVAGYPLRWVETFRFVRATGKYEHTLIVESASGKGHRLVVHLPLRGYSRSRPLLQAWVSRCVKKAFMSGFAPHLPRKMALALWGFALPVRRKALVLTLPQLLPEGPLPQRAPAKKRAARAPAISRLVRGRRSS